MNNSYCINNECVYLSKNEHDEEICTLIFEDNNKLIYYLDSCKEYGDFFECEPNSNIFF